MKIDQDYPSGMSDKAIKEKISEWTNDMFTRTDKGADINSILLYTPLISLGQNELTGRFVKRSTRIAIGISFVALMISLLALLIVGAQYLNGTPLEMPEPTVGTRSQADTATEDWVLSLYRE